MAKLRTNHIRHSKGKSKSPASIIGILILGAIVLGLQKLLDNTNFTSDDVEVEASDNYERDELYFFPKGNYNKIIKHQYFALSYAEEHELAEWVAYELTRKQLRQDRVRRENNFEMDDKIRTQSATLKDYRGSGYDRGHLVPAADRAFSRAAMDETFLLSNVAPQNRKFNGGIWRELEELTRDWAYDCKKLYIVTGPILPKRPKETIGRSKVTVPDAFYKVILDVTEPELKGIAYIIPNEPSYKHLNQFAVSIDEVERQTGIDFFADFLEEDLEAQLEGTYDVSLWDFDDYKFKKRKEQWN